MTQDNEKEYGVIVEWKDEGPIIMEGKLMTWDEANQHMKIRMGDPRVIRVAMFRCMYAAGNLTLFPDTERL